MTEFEFVDMMKAEGAHGYYLEFSFSDFVEKIKSCTEPDSEGNYGHNVFEWETADGQPITFSVWMNVTEKVGRGDDDSEWIYKLNTVPF